MSSICFYFQVHQPFRIKKYRMFDMGDPDYFNTEEEVDLNNRWILEKVARKSYLPTNRLLLDLLKKHPEFKVSFSLSGVLIEQLALYAPEVLESFIDLVDTGRVEILSETYYHSLAFMYSEKEYATQIEMHRRAVQEIFGVTPTVFRNTELIYNNDISNIISSMGFKGMLAEGADHVLEWRSPNHLYSSYDGSLPLLLKNYKLSDDIAFRFGCKEWSEYPLTADKFSHWVAADTEGEVINLFMDYETFGEHQWEDTGIFGFLEHLPTSILAHGTIDFVTPSEALERYAPVGALDVPHYVSWADVERDISAWRSNEIQHDALRALYELEEDVLATQDESIIEAWRKFQTSDHFYYMCTKWFEDGDVHKYFNPYESPYEAFITFMNALQDLSLRVKERLRAIRSDKEKKRDRERKLIPQRMRGREGRVAAGEACFRLAGDKVLEDIHDLYQALAFIPDEEFHHHVRDEQNDFAAWLREVLEEREAADEVERATKKDEMRKVLFKYIYF